MPVLRPLPKEELKTFFSEHSLKVFQFFMNTSLFAQPEVFEGENSLSIQIPKEHLEQWFVQALQVQSVGAGSYPIDILNPGKWGADIKMLSCKLKNNKLTKADSGETSLAQKFKSTGVSLDDMFKKKEFQEIINGWVDIWAEKMNLVKKERGIEKIYYFFFLRGTTEESYFCGFEVSPELINTKNITKRDEDEKIVSSVFLSGVIDPNYGNSKIYKSKKRLELRLKPKKLKEKGFLIPIKTDKLEKENIYKLVQNEKKYSEYLEKKLKKFLEFSKLN